MSYDTKYRVGTVPLTKLKPKRVRTEVDLTLWEKMYVPEILRGLSITTKHLVSNLIGFVFPPKNQKRKIFTIYYPEEKYPLPAAYRGRPALVQGKDGKEKCVACGLCERICPASAIKIEYAEDAQSERYPSSYILDVSRCVYCGLCEEVCPKEAIVMSDEYEGLCEYNRTQMIYVKERLLIPEDKLKKRIDYIRAIYCKDTY
jgi:NADH-quinone oxidoreductase subunit I